MKGVPALQHKFGGVYKLLESKPVAFFHDHVRHVCFVLPRKEVMIKILSVCDATVNLMIFHGNADASLLPLLGTLPLQRLTIDLSSLFRCGAVTRDSALEVDFSHPLFSQITHLHLLDFHESGWECWQGLAQLPRFTHLAITHRQIANSVYRGVLAHCKSLEVLIYLNAHHPQIGPDILADPRFVMFSLKEFRGDWEKGAWRGDDYWAACEILVKKRQSGETGS
ncbi:hypothetical protein B0H19DRAFT_1104232, partial [Mycena capillaripes]